MATYKHIRSATANKRPTTSIADGQLAINTNTASPGLFFKDSAGTGIVKVGPVHVGTTAPNSSPATGGSTGNYLGEQWLDTSVSPAQMKVWNGSAWVGIVADELPVSKLQDGAARQLIQTDAAGTGVEWTSNVDVPGTLDVTSTATFDSIAQHPLGTAGAPTITFTGDNNTGIYSPGADQLALSTNGTGRLFIDAGGKVEVATATGSSSITPTELRISSTTDASDWNTTNPWARLAFYSADTTNGARTRAAIDVVQQFSNGNVSAFSFKTDNGSGTLVERQRISYTGTTTLTSAATTEPLIVKIDTSEVARIDSSGKVGIGTSNVTRNFVVQSASQSDILIRSGNANYAQLLLGDTDAEYRGAISYDHQADKLFIVSAGSTAVTVDSSQRVGIGVTSPVNALEVNGNIKLADSGTGASYIVGTKAGNSFYFGCDNSTGSAFSSGTAYSPIIYTGAAAPITFTNSGTERARIDSSGRLLVGTSSALTATNAQYSKFIVRGASSGSSFDGRMSLSRGTAASSLTADSAVGSIYFTDIDSNEFAAIIAQVDGTTGASDAPGRLVFSTTADAASSPTERLRIDSSGRVGIGTTSPGSYSASADNLVVYDAANSGITIASSSTGTGQIYFADGTTGTERYRGVILYDQANDSLRIDTAALTRVTIDSSGRLLVGTSSARSNFYNTSGSTTALQVEGTTNNTSGLSIVANISGDANAPRLVFGKSAGTTIGSNTLVALDENLGRIAFQGNDGTEFVQAGEIRCDVDGTPGANDMPGRLVFSTTPSGSATPVEHYRIASGGALSITSNVGLSNLRQTTYNASSNAVLGVFGASNGDSVNNGSVYNIEWKMNGNASGQFWYANYITYTGTRTLGAYCTGTAWTNSSDIANKEEIVDTRYGLNTVLSLRPVDFRWKSQRDEDGNGKPDIGFIAQEMEQIIPEVVTGAEGSKGISYGNLVSVLTKAIQEQQAMIAELQAEVAALKAQ